VKKTLIATAFASTMVALLTSPAWAGRPLSVDDANTNDKGAGHVETWIAREPGKTNTANLAPVYAPIEGLELGALFSRDTSNSANLTALQGKWRITPSQARGCNLAATLGALHVSHQGGNGSYLNGIYSCNGNAFGNVHMNLGLLKVKGDSTRLTWGAALEHEMGSVTPHIELFGVEGSKPTLQIGARTQLSKALQLDGTVGRNQSDTVLSLGVKFQF
jgi:hypothetical protein